MSRRTASTVALLAAAVVAPVRADDADRGGFLAAVPVRRAELLAARYRGRTAILDTVAREQLGRMCGVADAVRRGAAPVVAYLDLLFRTGAHLRRPLIRVRSAALRRRIADGLTGTARDEFVRTRRLPALALM
ncbi:MAG: hypothetical protein ACOC8F_06500, partial [Planctomycetota bacterium]